MEEDMGKFHHLFYVPKLTPPKEWIQGKLHCTGLVYKADRVRMYDPYMGYGVSLTLPLLVNH
jgi:hypothetical protein